MPSGYYRFKRTGVPAASAVHAAFLVNRMGFGFRAGDGGNRTGFFADTAGFAFVTGYKESGELRANAGGARFLFDMRFVFGTEVFDGR